MKRFTPWLAGLSMIAAGLALAEAPKVDQARIDAMLKQVQAQMAAQPQQPGAPLPNIAKPWASDPACSAAVRGN